MKHQPATAALRTSRTARSTRSRAAAQAAAGTRAAPAHPDPQERDGAVRQAAYAFYEARGCLDGFDLQDWLDAEAQVDQALAQSVQAIATGTSQR